MSSHPWPDRRANEPHECRHRPGRDMRKGQLCDMFRLFRLFQVGEEAWQPLAIGMPDSEEAKVPLASSASVRIIEVAAWLRLPSRMRLRSSTRTSVEFPRKMLAERRGFSQRSGRQRTPP